MTLRAYQIHTLIILAALLVLAFPIFSFAAGLIESTIWGIVIGFFGWLVGIAGAILDFAIREYVIGFGASFKTGGVGVAVDTLWVTVRDIFNLTFIFGLVYIGFKMILGSDDTGTRRWLVSLIIAALLVNFSLFITKFIVDFSNILATEIAQGFPTVGGKVAVSTGYMDSLGINKILEVKDLPTDAGWSLMFGATILFLVMTFTFAAGGIMLIIRYAALCLFMVMSPLMFLGSVFPQLQSVTSKYWSGFIGRAFFAPLYLLFVYFSYFIITTIYGTKGASGEVPDFINILQVQSGATVMNKFGATIMPFILSCIFLIASIVIASKLGADGGNASVGMMKSAGNWTQKKAKQYAWGTAKFATTQTAGRAARRGSEFVGSRLERQISNMQTKGGIGGYLARTQLGEAARQKSAGVRDAKFGLGASLKEDREKSAAIGTAARKRQEDQENSAKRNEAAQKYQEANERANNKSLSDADREAAAKEREHHRADLAQRTKNTSDDELREMDKEHVMALAEHLSDKQIEVLEKSGNYSTFGAGNDIQILKEARRTNTLGDYINDLDDATVSTDRLSDAIKAMADTMKNMSDERLTGMNASQLIDPRVAMHLSNDQMRTLRSSGKYSATDIAEIEKARETGINETITNGSVANMKADGTQKTGADINANATDPAFQNKQRENLFKRSVADVGKLPVNAFTQVQAFDHISPAMLQERLKNGVSDSEMVAIRTALAGHLGVNPPDLKNVLLTNSHFKDNKWTKWMDSKSSFADQFFA